jgi:hypothetical protein
MSRTIRTVALFASVSIVLSFAVLVINQTAQVVQLASTVHPQLGTVTLWTLVVVYTASIGVPVVMILRLPSPLRPPQTEVGPEFDAHVKRLGERLAANPHLAGRPLNDRAEVEEGLEILALKTDAIVKETAAGVFLATAVSQSGRLDGLLVLAAQSRMIWKIAHIYHQRPGLRDVAHLYANVAGTVFLASEFQDIDLAEQVEPIFASTIGSLGANVPGLKVAATILSNCILSGSANAFLTLRVGMIAKRYSGALVVEPKPSLRRAATAEAAKQLGAIVADGSRKITTAFLHAAAGKVADVCSGTADMAKDAGVKFLTRVGLRGARQQPAGG